MSRYSSLSLTASAPPEQRQKAFHQFLHQHRCFRRSTRSSRLVFALNDDPFFCDALGAAFVDYYVHIKNAEIERFQAEVSDWEHREYFEMF